MFRTVRGRLYTCPNSSMMVEIHKIRYQTEEYAKYWINYYSLSGRLINTERKVKVYFKNIQHWTKV